MLNKDNRSQDPFTYETYQTVLARLKLKEKQMYRQIREDSGQTY